MPRLKRRFALMLLALGVFCSATAGAAGAPYGKDFLSASAAWPQEMPAQAERASEARSQPATLEASESGTENEPGEDASAPSLRSMLSALRKRAEEEEYRGGPYAPGLAETLGDLARLLEESGASVEAMEVRERALHLLRINEGLYSPNQGPIVRDILLALRRAGDFDALDQRYDYFYRLYGSGQVPRTELRWAATKEYLRWQREALRRNLGGDLTRRLLDLYYLHDDLLESFVDEDNESAAATTEDWEQQRDVVLSKLSLLYLMEELVDPLPESIQQQGPFNQSRDPMESDPLKQRLDALHRSLRPRGKALLTQLLASIPSEESVATAETKLALADWLQWHGSNRQARVLYEELWRFLQSENLGALAQSWFEKPVPLPDNGAFFQPNRGADGPIAARIKVSARGRARAETPAVSTEQRRAATRLRRLINTTQFRPAIKEGEVIDAQLQAAFVVYKR